MEKEKIIFCTHTIISVISVTFCHYWGLQSHSLSNYLHLLYYCSDTKVHSPPPPPQGIQGSVVSVHIDLTTAVSRIRPSPMFNSQRYFTRYRCFRECNCGCSKRVPGAVRGRGAARGAAVVPRGGAHVRRALPPAGAAAPARAPAPHLRAPHGARPPLRTARPQGDRGQYLARRVSSTRRLARRD